MGLGKMVGQRREVLRVAGAGDDVLALGVGQEVARGSRLSGSLVAAEGDAGARAVAAVAEDHLLDVDRGAPVVGDAVDPAVGDRALPVPGVEHRGDRLAELLARLERERLAGRLLEQPPEGRGQLAQLRRPRARCRRSTPLRSLASCSACSKLADGIPRTTLPNICTNRR